VRLAIYSGLADPTLAMPGWAHCSLAAQYDADAPVTLTSVFTTVEWTNPHARFYVDMEYFCNENNQDVEPLQSPPGL
jgi:hypothetical protein